MASHVQAVVFDCFGVLATDGWLPFKQKYFGKNPDLLDRATEMNKKVDAGLADYDEFIAGVAQLARVSERNARAAIEDNVPNEQLLAYIATELKPRYKIGMLSNAGDNWLAEIFEQRHINLFDAVALSYETGYIKPHERSFEIIAERLGVPIGTCILVDDQERYCTGAREAGMLAIWYHDFEQFRTELKKLMQS